MKLLQFREQTTTFAKDQPQYQNLPAHVFQNDPQGKIAFCWKLTLWERLLLLLTGKIWHQVLTFNDPLQPQMMSLAKPKMKCRYPFPAWTCFRLCVTWCIQAQGAPFRDRATVQSWQGRRFEGWCFVLRFWKMRRRIWGDWDKQKRTPEPMAALVIAWEPKPQPAGKPSQPEQGAEA